MKGDANTSHLNNGASQPSQPATKDEICVNLVSLPPLAELASTWQDLQARSDHSFFTSWAWIGCWLETLPPTITPLLLTAKRAGKIVGAGILIAKTRKQMRFLETPALHLHATGDPDLDLVTIEYNGFLADRSDVSNTVAAMLGHLFRNAAFHCNEVFMPGAVDRESVSACVPAGTRMREIRNRPCYSVDLNVLRDSSQDYMSTLSASRRYYIRRSLKEYAKLGIVNLSIAQTAEEAMLFLCELRKLHQIYWESKGRPGAFANKFLDAFIHRLVRNQFANGHIQLLRVSAADRPIGYLLNFTYQGKVYQYQSGFDYALCEKHNAPGYVCHVYGVEHNLKAGYMLYDYMAGESAYKKTLGRPMAELSWQVVQRNSVALGIEDKLRGIARLMRRLSSK